MHKPLRETFHIVGQAAYNAVPMSGSYVIVDTNVLSILERIADKGYNPSELQQRRGAHFLRWLLRSDVDLVNTTFALLEGSGFHSGPVSLYSLLHRSLPFEALRCLDEGSLDIFLASRTGSLSQAPVDYIESHYKSILEEAAGLLPTQFGPAYLVALQLRLCDERKLGRRETAMQVMDLLARRLNFVPAVPWLTTMLSCFARNADRRTVAQEILKHTDKRKRKAVLSGAWDLAYLSFLSGMRAEVDTASDAKIGQPVLVTDDDALARLAAQIHADGSSLFLDDGVIDPHYSADCEEMSRLMRARRFGVRPSKPSLSGVIELARELEAALDVPPLGFLVKPPKRVIEPNLKAMSALLRLVPTMDGVELLEGLVRARSTGDLLFEGLRLARTFVESNARAHKRTELESLAYIVDTLRRRSESSAPPQIGEMIVVAWVRRLEIYANSALERVEVIQPGLYGPALGYVVLFLREILTDTATAQHETLDIVLARLMGNLEALQSPAV
jgi:hypothetical protein